MIIKTNNEKREYILNECEKQEIENIYACGGRYFYLDDIFDEETDGLTIYDSNKNVLDVAVWVYGDTAKVLKVLAEEFSENKKFIFDIMQLYPNSRQIKLTEYEKDIFRYMYDKLGARYFALTGSKISIYNDEKQFVKTDIERLESVIFNLHLKANDEIYDKCGYICVEKIINKFCK